MVNFCRMLQGRGYRRIGWMAYFAGQEFANGRSYPLILKHDKIAAVLNSHYTPVYIAPKGVAVSVYIGGGDYEQAGVAVGPPARGRCPLLVLPSMTAGPVDISSCIADSPLGSKG